MLLFWARRLVSPLPGTLPAETREKLWAKTRSCQIGFLRGWRAWGTSVHARSCSMERVGQVRAQIVQVLDPDRQAQQTVGEPHREPRIAPHRGMGHRSRMTHQALPATQALG